MRKIINLTLFFCAALIAQNTWAQETIQVPFDLDNGQIIVERTYSKKLPLRMVVSNFYSSFQDDGYEFIK